LRLPLDEEVAFKSRCWAADCAWQIYLGRRADHAAKGKSDALLKAESQALLRQAKEHLLVLASLEKRIGDYTVLTNSRRLSENIRRALRE
jgi:hypothetical protein